MRSFTKATNPPKSFELSSRLKKYHFKAMGSRFELGCFPQSFFSEDDVHHLFKDAEAEVLRIQNKFTEFQASPFNLINDFAGKKAISVDDETFYLLKKAQSFYRLSNGSFQISTSSLSLPWKRLAKQGLKLEDKERQRLASFIDDSKIWLSDACKQVFLPVEGMRIGLGGLGKGYAVDRAFTLLQHKGLMNFYVSGGGDTRYHSHVTAPRKWRVGIQNPFRPQQEVNAGWIEIANGSISTSGSYIQKVGQGDHHIIDQHGASQRELLSVSIIAKSCLETDAWGTILMSQSWEQALVLVRQHRLKVVMIHQSGKVFQT